MTATERKRPLPFIMSSHLHCLQRCPSPLPFIMSFHVHCLVSSKKFKFKFIQGYPEKDIPRRWTKKREMNAIIVAREARDEGKKDLERVNREVERVNREVERR